MKLSTKSLTGCLLGACLAACNQVGDGDAPGYTQTETSAAGLTAADASSVFIVTHLDQRDCLSPVCGGYFVQAVNLRHTRCADGNVAAECHAFRLDFAPSGI